MSFAMVALASLIITIPTVQCLPELSSNSATSPIESDSYFYGQSPAIYPAPIASGSGDWSGAYQKAKRFVAHLTLDEKVEGFSRLVKWRWNSRLCRSILRLGIPLQLTVVLEILPLFHDCISPECVYRMLVMVFAVRISSMDILPGFTLALRKNFSRLSYQDIYANLRSAGISFWLINVGITWVWNTELKA